MITTERKYTSTGREVDVIQELDNGSFLVYGIRVACGCDYQEPEPFLADKVFDEPPTRKYSEEIGRLELEVQALRDERCLIQLQMRDLDGERKAQVEKLQRHKQLKYLEDFLDGKITHYVIVANWHAPKILTLEETVSEYGYPKGLRLLGLYGNSKGDLAWQLNRYRDGSGTETQVTPCTSYEQALEVLQQHFDDITAYVEGDKNRTDKYLITAAHEYNLHISDEYIQRCNAASDKNRQEKIAKLEEQLAQLRTTKEV